MINICVQATCFMGRTKDHPTSTSLKTLGWMQFLITWYVYDPTFCYAMTRMRIVNKHTNVDVQSERIGCPPHWRVYSCISNIILNGVTVIFLQQRIIAWTNISTLEGRSKVMMTCLPFIQISALHMALWSTENVTFKQDTAVFKTYQWGEGHWSNVNDASNIATV